MRCLWFCGVWLAVFLTMTAEAASEFRGAWVATVHNIDWPSKPGLSPETQKAQLRAILDRAVELKLNAILFQVRPASDALVFLEHRAVVAIFNREPGCRSWI